MTDLPSYVVGGLFVVNVMIDGEVAEFVNMHIRPLQAVEEAINEHHVR